MPEPDINLISVNCAISGCFANVIGDTRCSAHGGHPTYQWTDLPFGEVEWTQQEGATDASTSA